MTAKTTTKLPQTSSAQSTITAAHLTDTQRWQVALLALAGALQPTPIPLTFLHKLYLKQYGWSMVYLLLGLTQIARVACAVEAVWYLLGTPLPRLPGQLQNSMTSISATSLPDASTLQSSSLEARAHSIRTLEQLRQDGLLSEYEFEQQRRQILELS